MGGKAGPLGEMLQAGLPVPDGFVITSRVQAANLSGPLELEIMSAFAGLGADKVAVRSSAVGEDSGAASWAGQLDTFLNTTHDGLIEAVKRCQGSIDSAQAQSYAREKKTSLGSQKVAVLVQRMVESEVSGVIFTTNPVSGEDELVIESVNGLGELLVQGKVTPETIRAEKTSGRVLSRMQGKQRSTKPVLSDDQVSELSNIASQIERHFGQPQDIEWAIERGKIYIVQSRPITALPKRSKQKYITWVTTVARRHTPLFLSLAVSGQDRARIQSVTGLPIGFSNIRREGLAFQFDKDELAAAKAVVHDRVARDGLRFFQEYAKTCERSAQKLLDATWQAAGKSDAEAVKGYFEVALAHASNLLVMITVQFELEDFLNAFVSERLNDAQKAEAVVAALKFATQPTHEVHNLLRLLELGAEVQASVPDYEEWIRLDADSLTGRIAGQFGKIQELIDAYRQDFGWMGRMYYAGQPESARDVVIRLQNGLKGDCAKRLLDMKNHRTRQMRERDAAIEALGKDSDARDLADVVSKYLYLRSYRLDVFFMAHERELPKLSRVAAKIGLSDVDELIHLTWQEIIEGLEGGIGTDALQSRARERREGFRFETRLGVTEWFASGVSEGRPARDESQNHEALKGVTACGGRVRGRVRVVLNDLSMVEMRPGEILVTTMTTPSLMLAVEKAAAIVTDEGGMLCHAAIVSRELNIPCVIGTESATRTLKTGDTVDVDATSGIVKLV